MPGAPERNFPRPAPNCIFFGDCSCGQQVPDVYVPLPGTVNAGVRTTLAALPFYGGGSKFISINQGNGEPQKGSLFFDGKQTAFQRNTVLEILSGDDPGEDVFPVGSYALVENWELYFDLEANSKLVPHYAVKDGNGDDAASDLVELVMAALNNLTAPGDNGSFTISSDGLTLQVSNLYGRLGVSNPNNQRMNLTCTLSKLTKISDVDAPAQALLNKVDFYSINGDQFYNDYNAPLVVLLWDPCVDSGTFNPGHPLATSYSIERAPQVSNAPGTFAVIGNWAQPQANGPGTVAAQGTIDLGNGTFLTPGALLTFGGFVDKTVARGKTYYYRVRAHLSDCSWTAYSPQTQVAVPTRPAQSIAYGASPASQLPNPDPNGYWASMFPQGYGPYPSTPATSATAPGNLTAKALFNFYVGSFDYPTVPTYVEVTVNHTTYPQQILTGNPLNIIYNAAGVGLTSNWWNFDPTASVTPLMLFPLAAGDFLITSDATLSGYNQAFTFGNADGCLLAARRYARSSGGLDSPTFGTIHGDAGDVLFYAQTSGFQSPPNTIVSGTPNNLSVLAGTIVTVPIGNTSGFASPGPAGTQSWMWVGTLKSNGLGGEWINLPAPLPDANLFYFSRHHLSAYTPWVNNGQGGYSPQPQNIAARGFQPAGYASPFQTVSSAKFSGLQQFGPADVKNLTGDSEEGALWGGHLVIDSNNTLYSFVGLPQKMPLNPYSDYALTDPVQPGFQIANGALKTFPGSYVAIPLPDYANPPALSTPPPTEIEISIEPGTWFNTVIVETPHD